MTTHEALIERDEARDALTEARAKLAALETESHADSDRWITERNEARAIARRLAAAYRVRHEAEPSPMSMLLLGEFNALPWAKEPK